jgi:hypothetical protein
MTYEPRHLRTDIAAGFLGPAQDVAPPPAVPGPAPSVVRLDHRHGAAVVAAPVGQTPRQVPALAVQLTGGVS